MKNFNFFVNRNGGCGVSTKNEANTPPCCFKRTSRFVWALVMMLTLGVGQMWAVDTPDETITFSAQSWSNNSNPTSASGTNCSFSFSNGTNANNAPKYTSNGSCLRLYGGNTMTISSTTKTFSKIVLSFASGEGSNDITTDVTTYSSGTWQGTATSVIFTIGGSSGHRRVTSVAIYYVASSLSSIAITKQPTKLAYVAGEIFSATGAEVTATYSDASSKTVSATWTPTGTLSAGLNQTATASYTENAVNKTATTTINVYSVTVQVVDEDGNPLSGVGMPSASATGKNITASAKGNNYVFKTWEFVGSNNGLSFGTATNASTTLSGTPTGNVTIKAVYHKPIAVTWKVNGKAWTPSAKSGVDGTAEVGYGEQVSTLPTEPTTAEFCGQKFMGWTKTEIGSEGLTDAAAISALNLFTTAGSSPAITTETTFHAVFADYGEE